MRIISGLYDPREHISEMGILTISRALHALAGALVGIFVPIYLFDLGYTVADILLFFSIYFAAKVLAHYGTINLIAKIGPKHTLAISYLLQFIFYGLLFSLEIYPGLFYIAPFVAGLYGSAILLSSHMDFSKAASGELGSDIAKFHIILGLTTALAPLAGGLIASEFGPNFIYLFAIFIIALALFPLYLTKEPIKNIKLNLRSVNSRRLKNWTIHQVSYNIASTTMVSLWPLFIAIFVFHENPYAGVGFIFTIALLVKILQTHFLGKTIDKNGVRKILKHSSWLGALTHVARGLMLTPLAVILFNIISELIHNANQMSYADEFYQAMNHKHRLEHLFYVEIFSDAAKLILFFSLFASTFFISSTYGVLVAGFLASAIAYATLGLTSNRVRKVI